MHDDEEVPPFQRIVELIGTDRAAQLSARFGGRRLYVPQRPGEHHPLSVAVGRAAALKLAEEFPSARLDIPLSEGKRARIIKMRLIDKVSVSEIARELICTERHVYQVLSDARHEIPAQQKTLFD